jgi:hypothetical protein
MAARSWPLDAVLDGGDAPVGIDDGLAQLGVPQQLAGVSAADRP